MFSYEVVNTYYKLGVLSANVHSCLAPGLPHFNTVSQIDYGLTWRAVDLEAPGNSNLVEHRRRYIDQSATPPALWGSDRLMPVHTK